MKEFRSILAGFVLFATFVTLLGLAACGPTPAPTATPSDTPWPTPTLRPTFTPTVLARATEEPSATAVPTKEATRPPATDTPISQSTRTPEPSATLPELTPTPAATRAAGPPPKLTGSLLFPVFDTVDQTYDIYRLDLAGGEMDKFIEQASQPAITPDGERVGWRSWKSDQRGLLSRPIDGTDIWRMISFNEAARPDWSPDGEQFVFPGRLEPDRESRLYLFTGVGGDEPFIEIQRHGSPIIGRVPAFLSDSGGTARIVYQGCVDDACGLLVMNVDGTSPQFLKNTFPDDTAPAVSPDGKQIVYMSKSSGYWQVKVVNTDGSDQRPLTDDWYWNGLPAWSPDGKYIVFVSTRDENWPDNFSQVDNAGSKFRLWIMDADGTNQRLLNDFAFRLDGVPAGVPADEVAGWIEERMVWLATATTD
jgi:hypothetical protein